MRPYEISFLHCLATAGLCANYITRCVCMHIFCVQRMYAGQVLALERHIMRIVAYYTRAWDLVFIHTHIHTHMHAMSCSTRYVISASETAYCISRRALMFVTAIVTMCSMKVFCETGSYWRREKFQESHRISQRIVCAHKFLPKFIITFARRE